MYVCGVRALIAVNSRYNTVSRYLQDARLELRKRRSLRNGKLQTTEWRPAGVGYTVDRAGQGGTAAARWCGEVDGGLWI